MAFEYIKNRFGSKKGLLRYLHAELNHRFGLYNEFKKVDFDRVSRLVFVCQGNICRSPLGEAIARMHGTDAKSFGLDTRGGDRADPRAIDWATARGIDLSLHTTSKVDDYLPLEGDLLIGMEPLHAQALKNRFAQHPVQITLAGFWMKSPCIYLHDPFNTDHYYFDKCEQAVSEATIALVQKLK